MVRFLIKKQIYKSLIILKTLFLNANERPFILNIRVENLIILHRLVYNNHKFRVFWLIKTQCYEKEKLFYYFDNQSVYTSVIGSTSL
jgi:hypothetical protein